MRFALFILLLFSTISVVAQNAHFSGGNGTPADPYRIATKEDLKNVAHYLGNPDVYFEVVNNINLGGEPWKPLGDYIGDDISRTFRGKFNGNNKRIYNIDIKRPSGKERVTGLFGCLYNGAHISNVIVEGIIRGGGDLDSYYATGAIAGLIVQNPQTKGDSIRVENCINKARIGMLNNKSTWYVGGLVGACIGKGQKTESTDISISVVKCVNMGSIISAGSEVFTGGIIGYATGINNFSLTVHRCYNLERLGGYGAVNHCGGIIGCAYLNSDYIRFSIDNCHNAGSNDVTGSTENGNYCGGIIGYLYGQNRGNTSAPNIKITSSYNYANLKNTKGYTGGITGKIYFPGSSSDIGVITGCYSGGIIDNPTGTTGGIAGSIFCNYFTVKDNMVSDILLSGKEENTFRIAGRDPGAPHFTMVNNYAFDKMKVNGTSEVSNDLLNGTEKTKEELFKKVTYSNNGWLFGSTEWTIRNGKSFPYFSDFSEPVYITELFTDSVSIDLDLPSDSLRVFSLSGTCIGSFSNPQTGRYYLPGIVTGDTLYFINYQSGKFPSYPVYHKVSLGTVYIRPIFDQMTYGEDDTYLGFFSRVRFEGEVNFGPGYSLGGMAKVKDIQKSNAGYYEAGKYAFEFSNISIKKNGRDLTRYYDIQFKDDSITIAPLLLAENYAPVDKYYDGDVHVYYSGGISGMKNGDRVGLHPQFRLEYENAQPGQNIKISPVNYTLTGADAKNYLLPDLNLSGNILSLSLSGLQITKEDSIVYTGKPIEPLPVVKKGMDLLVKDQDYTLSYRDNIDVGKAYIIITGKGKYSGTQTVEFNIIKVKQGIHVYFPDYIALENEKIALEIEASSGLPLIYRVEDENICRVDRDILYLNGCGKTVLTVTQPGDRNYHPATAVTIPVTIYSTGLKDIIVSGAIKNENGEFVMSCGEEKADITILTHDPNANVYYEGVEKRNFTVAPSQPGTFIVSFSIADTTGNHRQWYEFHLIKPFLFEDIIKVRWNSTLAVNNNPDSNGGFHFTAYEWFCNEVSVGKRQYLYTGNRGNLFQKNDLFRVELESSDFAGRATTCPFTIDLTQNGVTVYPNPVGRGENFFIDFGTNRDNRLVEIAIYDMKGKLMDLYESEDHSVQLPASYPSGVYILRINSEGVSENFKILVK